MTKVNLSVDIRLYNKSWKLVKDVLTCLKLVNLLFSFFFLIDWYILKRSRRRFEDVWKAYCQDHFIFSGTLWRVLEDILKTFKKANIFALLKTSWRSFLKTYDQGKYINLIKMSWLRLKDVFWKQRLKTPSTSLQ